MALVCGSIARVGYGYWPNPVACSALVSLGYNISASTVRSCCLLPCPCAIGTHAVAAFFDWLQVTGVVALCKVTLPVPDRRSRATFAARMSVKFVHAAEPTSPLQGSLSNSQALALLSRAHLVSAMPHTQIAITVYHNNTRENACT